MTGSLPKNDIRKQFTVTLKETTEKYILNDKLLHRTKKIIKTLCLKEMNSQKRNTQNSNFKEENSSRFHSWGLQRTVVKNFVQ